MLVNTFNPFYMRFTDSNIIPTVQHIVSITASSYQSILNVNLQSLNVKCVGSLALNTTRIALCTL